MSLGHESIRHCPQSTDNGARADCHDIVPIEGTQMASRWMKTCSASLIGKMEGTTTQLFQVITFFHICLPRNPSPFVSLPRPQHHLVLSLTLAMAAGVFVLSLCVCPSTTQGRLSCLLEHDPPHRIPCIAFLADRVLLTFICVHVLLWFIHFNNYTAFPCVSVPQFLG